ncbi:MAG: hypothetical protein GX943_02840 [Candidatus Pacebacteria bacterium]|jgi:hypothetical protein|nr:hypothetical protein [Candidatus Paceibacterota bacterium]
MSENKQQGGSFLSGLAIGFSLGALISYFSSETGQKTWKKLAKDWEKARLDLYKKGLIESPHLSLEEIKDKYYLQLKNSLFEFKDNLSLALVKFEQSKDKEKARKHSWRKQKKNQFKGI